MWVIAMFDLPTETANQRKEYARFRKKLVQRGFLMMQFSVYVRNAPTHEDAEKHSNFVETIMPPEGSVRVMSLTSQQFARMKCFHGEIAHSPEKEPEQLSFF
jgi:CRISPR-associated protein Cas2